MSNHYSSHKKINTAIIIDNYKISHWAFQSLLGIKDLVSIRVILNCNNTKIKRNIFKNTLYYIINYFSIRNLMSKKNIIKSEELSSSAINIIDFNSEYDGFWQIIPKNIFDDLAKENIDLVIKFGMNLLKIPELMSIKHGVISFHHGNPAKYRGRPAGFYELYSDEKNIGVIVQRITNKIDSGDVIAYLESKIYNYSYKKTLFEAYENSIYLLKIAVKNIINEKNIEHDSSGKNYRLPNNLIALKFCFKLIKNKLYRIIYGLFYEKMWSVAIEPNIKLFDFFKINDIKNEKIIPINKKKYTFYADPFWLNKNTILVEALSKKSLKGEIIKIYDFNLKNIATRTILKCDKHYSYPCVFSQNGNNYILPEMSDVNDQRIFIFENDDINSLKVKGLNNIRIIDPTYFFINRTHYIFGSLTDCPWGRLYIWYSKESFLGEYIPHPNNPVKISPNGSRMAGSIIKLDGKVYRLGQDNSDHYGNGVYLFEILELNENCFIEKEILYKRWGNRKGPHTINLNLNSNQIVYDFYLNKFNLFAGIKRVISRI